MEIYQLFFKFFIIVLIGQRNNTVFSITNQQYDPDLVIFLRRAVYDFYQHEIFEHEGISAAKRFQKMQDEVSKSTPFYCDAKNGPGKRSSQRPTSIHRLRPGDIDIIAAIGESLTGGTGLTMTKLDDFPIENRGMIFSIGGQSTWRKITTLPNILKEFNPKLYGYSIRNANSRARASKFNVAEGAGESRDLLYEAKVLRLRLIHDPKVNMTHDWKLVTIFIGGIDFCHYICYEKNGQIPIQRHEQDLVKALRYLRDNIPRLMVNIILPPNMSTLVRNKRSIFCQLFGSLLCPCYNNKPKKWIDRIENILFEWDRKDIEIANRDEFRTNEFTVNVQTFTRNFTIPILKNGIVDPRYFSLDCLHFSQRMHNLAAIALWNNMLEYEDEKTGLDYRRYVFKCPTNDRPFLTTNSNKGTQINHF